MTLRAFLMGLGGCVIRFIRYINSLQLLRYNLVSLRLRILSGLEQGCLTYYHDSPIPTRSSAPARTSPHRLGVSILIGQSSRKLTNSEELSPDSEPSGFDVMPIDMLPDDVLLEIFDFCVIQISVENLDFLRRPIMEAWQPLVHVCRRWRSLVFGSSNRLNLRLVCTSKTPARDTLDVWPDLPLLIWDPLFIWDGDSSTEGLLLDNVIPILERSDRVRQIRLGFPASEWEAVSAAMQVPFPELTYLWLELQNGMVATLPDSFLGGSAPHLDTLSLSGVSFPGLPKLFLSATHLVFLLLKEIPHSGYISPEAMVTALSTLTTLGFLWLGFASPRSCPDQASRHPPPRTRTVFPFLSSLIFIGVSEYLEDFVAHIDAPRLSQLTITFFNDLEFDTPQSIQFIHRTPLLGSPEKARVFFRMDAAGVVLTRTTSYHGRFPFTVEIECGESDWQVSSLEQVCTSSLLPLSTLEDLYIYEDRYSPPDWQDNVENMQWLELLRPFAAVKNLYLSKEFAPRIAPALRELVGERTTAVLPALRNIFLEEFEPSGPVQEAIGQFVAARQVTSHPIAVSLWDNSEQDKGLL